MNNNLVNVYIEIGQENIHYPKDLPFYGWQWFSNINIKRHHWSVGAGLAELAATDIDKVKELFPELQIDEVREENKWFYRITGRTDINKIKSL